MSIDALTAQFNMTSPVNGSKPLAKGKTPFADGFGGKDTFAQTLNQDVDPKNIGQGLTRAIPEINNQGVEQRASEVEMAQLRSQQATLGEASRQAAMEDFLVQMQSELNIEPDQIIQAFSELETEELFKTPEETAHLVIQNLNLPQEKIPLAEGLFEQMLVKTTNGTMAETMKESGRDLSLDVYTQKELRQKKNLDSIDQMSRTFFVDNRATSQQMAQQSVEAPQIQDTTRAFKAYDRQNLKGEERHQNGLATSAAATAGMSALMASESGAETSELTKLMERPASDAMSAIDFDLSKLSKDAVTPFSSSEMKTSDLSENFSMEALSSQEALDQEVPDMDWTATSELSHGQELNATTAPMAQAQSGGSGGEKDAKEHGREEGHEVLHVRSGETERTQGKTFIVPTTAAATARQGTEVNGNVREIINQAQFMIKKGGGEMKMILQPEGLGEVHLKVAVQDGQVQIAMVADTLEAKEILQKGLVDLKSTLASHKLNVDGIRVDVGQQAGLDLNNQNQDPAQRHFAQQFLNEFRQENESWRRGFMDTGGARRITSQIGEGGSSSTMDPQSVSEGRARRRLDLVA